MDVPQVDYRANPSFAGDVAQGVDSPEQPNAAPAVFLPATLPIPDTDGYITDEPPIAGYVQEGFGLDVEIPVRDSWAQLRPDVAGGRHTSW